MGNDILNGLSPNELKKEIDRIVTIEQRSIPPRAKTFAAVVKIQKFDVLPELVTVQDLTAKIKEGYLELNRGMAGTKGVSALFYAQELILGSMYPGTLSALGNGIYCAEPSQETNHHAPGFPRLSAVAQKYTNGDGFGVIVRLAVKKGMKIVSCDDLRQDLRENRNRAKLAGITDIGTFAAALGIDAYYSEGIYDDTNEKVFTVVNRGALIVQNSCLKFKN